MAAPPVSSIAMPSKSLSLLAVATALIVKRREHIINLFIWPVSEGAHPALLQRSASTIGGYNMLHWTAGGMNFWAVSDLNTSELHDFAEQFEAHTRSPS